LYDNNNNLIIFNLFENLDKDNNNEYLYLDLDYIDKIIFDRKDNKCYLERNIIKSFYIGIK
jgi:hypothetical protein